MKLKSLDKMNKDAKKAHDHSLIHLSNIQSQDETMSYRNKGNSCFKRDNKNFVLVMLIVVLILVIFFIVAVKGDSYDYGPTTQCGPR